MVLKQKYFSAHNHTEYSNLRLLDSINTTKSLIDRAIDLNLAGVAITDHEVLSSHVEAIQYYKELVKQGKINTDSFKLVLGDEIYLVHDVREMHKNYTSNCGYWYYHFILLAKDKIGYQLLKEISSTAWANAYTQRGVERVPIDFKQISQIISKNPGHLIASTACLGGQLSTLILKLYESEKNYGIDSQESLMLKQSIHNFLEWCINTFGRDDFYLEVQPSNNKEQIIVNERMKSIANFYNLKMIFSTDSHYPTSNDRYVHKAYLNSMDGEREVDDFYATSYMMDQEEVWTYLSKTFTEVEFFTMVEHTHEIASKCIFYDLYAPQAIPELKVKHYDKPETFLDGYEYLMKMANSDYNQDRYWLNECMSALHAKKLKSDTYWTRLNEEAKELWLMSDILGLRMTAYYNTMQKIIEIVWNQGNSLVGPARGSATGFLSCYLLGITQLDPIVWNLPHWRHLTHTRPELPKSILGRVKKVNPAKGCAA